jgi:hypothetical protein
MVSSNTPFSGDRELWYKNDGLVCSVCWLLFNISPISRLQSIYASFHMVDPFFILYWPRFSEIQMMHSVCGTNANKFFSEKLSPCWLLPQARDRDPHDATLFANRSICWLRLGDAEHALFDAQHCKRVRPRWSKAWYREGAALSLLKVQQLQTQGFR